MWQPPSAGTVATHLGVGQRFLPGQAAQGPMVAPAAWQLDVWSLHWQGCASTGQLPVFFGEGCIFITQVQ